MSADNTEITKESIADVISQTPPKKKLQLDDFAINGICLGTGLICTI